MQCQFVIPRQTLRGAQQDVIFHFSELLTEPLRLFWSIGAKLQMPGLFPWLSTGSAHQKT